MKKGKVILCHASGKAMYDPHNWEQVEYDIKEEDKVEKAILNELSKFDAIDFIQKAGNTWSTQLMRKYPNSRWITYRGNHLLIQSMGEGKTAHARVVFSANPAFEHLKLLPKTHEDYKDIAADVRRRKKQRGKSLAQATEEDKAKSREAVKQRQLEKRGIKSSMLDYLQKVAEDYGVAYPEKKKPKAKPTKDEKEEVKRKIDPELAELLGIVQEESEATKNKVIDALAEISHEEIVKKTVEDLTGEQFGNEELTKANEVIVEKDPQTNEWIAWLPDGTELRDGFKTRESVMQHVLDNYSGLWVDTPEKSWQDQFKAKQEEDKKFEINTGNKELDKKLNKLNLTIDDALLINQTVAEYKAKMREIDKKYKGDILLDKRNLEVTSLQGIGIMRWGEDFAPKDEAIEKVLNDELTRMRADSNSELYGLMEQRLAKTSFKKSHDNGAIDTVNAISNVMLNGSGLNSDLLRFIGAENAGRVVAGGLVQKLGAKKAIEELSDFMVNKGQDVVNTVLDNTKERFDNIKGMNDLLSDGIYLDATVYAAMGREHGAINRELGASIGSLETTATILDSLRSPKDIEGDIVVDGGRDIDRLTKKLKSMGLTEDDYILGKRGQAFDVTIPYENFGRLLSEETFADKRDKTVEDIKTGKSIDPDWLPTGMPKFNYDFASPKAYKEMQSTNPDKAAKYEKYTNTKGEPAYTSEYPEGTTLYRKKNETKFFESAQKLVKMAMAQKRVLGNLGAGTGKTGAFLGIAQELKATGKLKTFHLHTMPSRLSDEFFKDAEKFYPDLRILNLQDVKDHKQRIAKLEAAKRGEFDVVIMGHDSIKQPWNSKKRREYVEAKMENYANSMTADGKDKPTRVFWRSGEGFDMAQKWQDEARQLSWAKYISELNPTAVTIDEAHEAIKDPRQKETYRSNAMKTLTKNAEYVVPATGTVIKNGIGDLAGMLHLVRPDMYPNPEAFAKKYENINQNTTMFQNVGMDGFNRLNDDVMITEKLTVTKPDGTKLKQTHNRVKVDLSPKQKMQFSNIEKTYHYEKNLDGFSIASKDNFNLVKENGAPKIIDNVDFQVYDSERTQTSRAKRWLTENGYDPNKYELVDMGRRGAAARRDSKKESVLRGGDWQDNASISKLHEIFDKHNAKKEPVVVFYDRKDSLQTMMKSFEDKYGFKMHEDMTFIDGTIINKTGKNSRKYRVTQFNQDPNAKIIFCSTAGKTGLNLQHRANTTIWFSRDNSYYREQQGNARVARKKQTKDTNHYYLDTNTLYDNRKYENIQRKRRTTEVVEETKESQRTLASEAKEAAKKIKKYRESKMKKSVIWVKSR